MIQRLTAITSPQWRPLFIGIAFVVGFYLLDQLSERFSHWPGISTWYPPAGLVFAFLLIQGPRMILWVVAAVALTLFAEASQLGLLPLVTYGVVKAGIYGLAAWLLRGRCHIDLSLRSVRDIYWLVTVAGISAAVLAVLVLGLDSALRTPAWPTFSTAVLHFWLGDLIAILTIGTFLAANVFRPEDAVSSFASMSGRLQLTAICLIAVSLVLAFVVQPGGGIAYYLCLPPVVWISYRLGIRAASLSILLLNAGALFSLYATGMSPASLLDLQLFMLSVALLGLFLGASTTQRLQLAETRTRLQTEQQRNQRLLKVSGIMPWEADVESSQFTFVGGQCNAMFGMSADEWYAKDFWDRHIHPADRAWVVPFCKGNVSNRRSFDMEYRMRKASGDYIWVHDVVSVLEDDDGKLIMQGFLTDISERKAMEEQLHHRNFHDLLTGLPNRILFLEQLNYWIENRPDSQTVWALVADIDRFGAINSSLGNAMGDDLLRQVTQRLEDVPGTALLARISGDQFAIITRCSEVSESERFFADVRDCFALPFQVEDDGDIDLQASIGVASCVGMMEAESLLRDAELAMRRAKILPDRFARFEPAMRHELVSDLNLDAMIKRGLENAEFEAHYQPIVDLGSQAIIGFEALARWNMPERGIVCPEDFIGAAESSGAIFDLDMSMLRQASTQLARWQEQFPQLEMHVNMSGRNLLRPEFLKTVIGLIDQADVNPGTLWLELTETILVTGEADVIRRLEALRKQDIGLCVDDFGTGYSSLIYINRLPVQKLKIDRSFVASIEFHKNREIVRAVVDLAHRLGLGVIAEGVETQAQREALLEMNCPCGQGYLFSRPLKAHGAKSLLDQTAIKANSE